MKKLRTEIKIKPIDLNTPHIYFEETRSSDGSPTLMPLVMLKTKPCSWFVNSGGCFMCGYQLSTTQDYPPTDRQLIRQTEYTIKTVPPETYPLITFNSAGSFLDPKEINDELRPIILRMLRNAGYREFNFECRPEFLLNKERVKQLTEYLDDGIISVGIGLESSNDFIRNSCVGKGTNLNMYIKAAQILKEHNIDPDAYIQLGKPFLTTKEDVEDAVKTAEFAFENGYKNIFLMLCNLQPTTLTHFLWKRGEYELPMLWRAIEVLKRLPTEHRSHAYIKGFNRAIPTPLEFPHNCESCTSEVVDKLIHWNLTGDFNHIKNMPECDCTNIFEQKLREEPKLELEERVRHILNLTNLSL